MTLLHGPFYMHWFSSSNTQVYIFCDQQCNSQNRLIQITSYINIVDFFFLYVSGPLVGGSCLLHAFRMWIYNKYNILKGATDLFKF